MHRINPNSRSLKLALVLVSCIVISIHIRSRNKNPSVNEWDPIHIHENEGRNTDFEQNHRYLKKDRRHKSNGFEPSFYEASSQSVEGINKILRKLKLDFPIETELPLSYGAKITLSDIKCHTFMLHDLDHSFALNEKNTEVTTDIFVNGITFGCSTKYQYEHGRFIRRPKGTAYITTKTSLDAQAKIFSSDFDTELPLTASISTCKAESMLDINLGRSFMGRLFSVFKSSIEETFRESVREILCSELENSGGEVITSMLSLIANSVEPFFEEDNSFDEVDKLAPQKDLDSEVNVELVDFTSPKFDDVYTDIFTFIDKYSSLFSHVLSNLMELSSLDFNDIFEIDMTSRKLEENEDSRKLFIDTSTLMTALVVPMAEAIISVIIGAFNDYFGSPEEFAEKILFSILDLFLDDDSDMFAINNRRVKEISPYRLFGGKEWSVDLFDFDFIPNKIQETFNDFKIVWNGASISGTPIDITSLSPIGKQTIDMITSISDLNLAFKFKLIWDKIQMKTDDFSINIPKSSFDLTFQTGISNVTLESSFLAAFHVPSNETFSKEKAIEWSCKFFPLISMSYLGLEGELKSPTVDGLFGSESSMDELFNGLMYSFFELFKGFYMDATSNFLGTAFINGLDDAIKGILKKTEERFQKTCEDL